jgi:hypothetical protein
MTCAEISSGIGVRSLRFFGVLGLLFFGVRGLLILRLVTFLLQNRRVLRMVENLTRSQRENASSREIPFLQLLACAV